MTSKITKILLILLPYVVANHYTFTNIGFGVFSSDVANLAIPIDVLQLKPVMVDLQKLIKQLQKVSKDHAAHQFVGPMLSSLAATAMERYLTQENKYHNVIHFFTKHEHHLPKTDPNVQSHLIPALNQKPDERPREREHMNTLITNNSIVIREDIDTLTNYTKQSKVNKTKRAINPEDYPVNEEELFIPFNQVPESSRDKRFIGTLFTSLLLSLGVSTVFGLMDNAKLNKLGSALESTQQRQELMIHQIEEDSKEIATNRMAIKSLGNVTAAIGKLTSTNHWTSVGNSAAKIIMSEIQKLDDILNLFIDIMEAASNHKMHFSVLTKDGAEQALKKIQELAKPRNLYPVVATTQQLAQLDCSYILTSRGFNLIVHVPLGNELSTFTIHRFQPLPIAIGSKVYGTLEPDNDIIAIGDSDHQGKPRFVEMSSTDLHLCKQIGGLYICRNKRIFTRPSHPTCLYSLFTGYHAKAVSQCHLTLDTRDEDKVVAVSDSQFIYRVTIKEWPPQE